MNRYRLFGTDGVRGEANIALTPELAMHLGMSAALWARREAAKSGRIRPRIVIGRDTRLSGDMLEAALTAGLAAYGVEVLQIGIAPTPAVSGITIAFEADAGIVISASHNPFHDNGIKFFGADGRKLPDAVEDEIAQTIPQLESIPRPAGEGLGKTIPFHESVEAYIRQIRSGLSSPEEQPLKGMRLVMDCANGASFQIAPRLFRELGAELILLHAEPDGVNINNNCGSTHPQSMAGAVLLNQANAGLAFDGDADRVIMADEYGDIVDGDRMMAILAIHLGASGRLNGNVVVATIMSNVGLEEALEERDIRLHRTDVGDRYVAKAMEELGAAIGGEQSGHLLLPQLSPTGDGIVTALQTLSVMRNSGQSLSNLASVVKSYPQLLRNIRIKDRHSWKDDMEIQHAITEGRQALGKPEWLSVRLSGTEPLLRVMAQGKEKSIVESVVHSICDTVQSRYGLD